MTTPPAADVPSAPPERAQSQDARSCVGEATLAAFAEGELDRGAHALVERHLADCSDCSAVVAGTAGAIHSGVAAASVPSNDHATHVSDSTGRWSEQDAGELASGTHVGRYIIDRLIGSGAMGAVYAASDPDLARTVAVKLLRSEALSDTARQQVRARLLREAQAMARLSHPEVITVYDVGAFGDQLFVAMEYVEGTTLRRWRAERYRGCAEILGVYERAGSGLAAAHEAGLVHRDFKPDNVLVGRDGRVRVTDFGLARSAGSSPPPGQTSAGTDSSLVQTLTRTGTLLGTPAYMAPEQLRGGTADARSDVFAFCVALYEALYGERPFAGSSVGALRMAIEQGRVRAAPVVNRVPGWTRTVLLRGLRAAPERRFESMRELLDGLRASRAASLRRVRRVAGISALGLLAATAAYVRGTLAGSRHQALVSSSPVAGSGNASPAGLPKEEESRPTRERADEVRVDDDAFGGHADARVDHAAFRGRAVPAHGPEQVAQLGETLPAAPPKRAVGTGLHLAPTSIKPAEGVPSAATSAGPAVGHNGAFILE